MVGSGMNMFTETFITVVLAAAIASAMIIPVSYAADVRAAAMVIVLADTVVDVVRGIVVNMPARVDARIWATAMAALVFIPMLELTKEALLFS